MIISLLAMMLVPPQSAPSADYIPDTGWRDSERDGSFRERWFGDQLRAMEEPPLARAADLGGFNQRFRLLVLPTFEPAYAYRIDVRQDGAAVLRWARLSGRGGYAPGALAQQGSRRLRPSELIRWRSALAAAALGSLAQEEHDGFTTTADGTETTLTICVDGTTFVFEHLDLRGRQFVTCSCDPDEEPLRRLARVVSRLKPRNAMDLGMAEIRFPPVADVRRMSAIDPLRTLPCSRITPDLPFKGPIRFR